MKNLINSISIHVKALEEGDVNIDNLDFLITQSNLLNERLIILRYKVYEEKQIKESVVLDMQINPVATTKEEDLNSTSINKETQKQVPEQQPFDFSLFSEEEEELIAPEDTKTIEEHYSETTIIEEEQGITEEITIKEHAATIEEGDSIMVINKEETTTISYSIDSDSISKNNSVATDHPLILQFRSIDKNLRSERVILPIESLIGSFTLTEKLQFINTLFGGSSEAFGTATKKLNEQLNMAGAILYLVEIAETNSWNFVKSLEIIEEFVLKLCRRYAHSPSA
ncbi:MAG: hypothetical protein NT109_01995 [Flavobacteriia bacterium]|nr:hypothetical protein [Flavobacteriia bacterium]